MDEKYLSDVINFDRDIKPYRLIQIYSGVGSGKNHWVSTLADKGHNILLITSRKATANAQAMKMGATDYIDVDKLCIRKESNMQNLCVCTNSRIEKFVMYTYDSDNPKTHIWKYFDIIILDEAHSLVSDATFSDAPFHVMKFLRHVQDVDERCKLVLMTGTPESIYWIISEGTKISKQYNYINCYNECIHVEPERVVLYPYEYAAREIVQLLDNEDVRIIYFANRIKHIKKIVEELRTLGVTEEAIGISFSDDNTDCFFSKSLIEKMPKIRESLVNEERVPRDIRIFITTTQNKEGINIIDEDIKIMFSESTQRTELIQMAGRIRKGLEALLVLYDTPCYLTSITDFEGIRDKNCLKKVNDSVDEFFDITTFNDENLKKVVSNIEKSFPNIRFNYFTFKFHLYAGKIKGNKQAHEDTRYIKECVDSWRKYPDSQNLGEGEIRFQMWFPNSDCSELFISLPPDERKKQLIQKVRALLEKNKCLDIAISKEQRDSFTEQLNGLLSNFNTKELQITYPVNSLKPALKKLGYSLESLGKHDKSGKWIIRAVV